MKGAIRISLYGCKKCSSPEVMFFSHLGRIFEEFCVSLLPGRTGRLWYLIWDLSRSGVWALNHGHLGLDNPFFVRVCCRIFSSIPEIHQLDASSTYCSPPYFLPISSIWPVATVTNLALPNIPWWDAPSEEPLFSSNWDEDTAFSGAFRSTKCTGLTEWGRDGGKKPQQSRSTFQL